MFGLCDAIWFALFLSRLAVNKIGSEGAGRLVEPLGKLTALQKLDLSCTG
jgi:Leucine-rich repeat (LRR) protein